MNVQRAYIKGKNKSIVFFEFDSDMKRKVIIPKVDMFLCQGRINPTRLSIK